ncbi:uncharacterized protein LOC133189017 [Saccostrea echinata]|uniref:uncharacterized protein LOC133176076 n=1 Tax=Saccostrea echinata TaxID=191078 RepID=UPI002A8377A3|nr:uncharacterized protein LOC133176076 [Saccostrea echinata]XP_061180445.1 uncharacterized protein LOC133189017 [Saccostrea echinata]
MKKISILLYKITFEKDKNMKNLELFFILTLFCTICAGSRGLRSTSKVEKVNQKARRCSSKARTHHLDDNSNEKQSDSRESKESQGSDENSLKADKALTISKAQKSVNVVDTDTMTIPEEEELPHITDMKPISPETECPDKADDICWDMEEHCNGPIFNIVLRWGTYCESDEDCKEVDPCQSGKCCEIPCENVQKMCRYPTNYHDLANSFSPERLRDS